MKLRSFLPILLGLFLIVACKNEGKQDDTLERQENYDSNEITSPEKTTSTSPPDQSRRVAGEDSSPKGSGNKDNRLDRAVSNASQPSEGKYIKDGETDKNCDCYCVDLTFSEITELCLKEETIFITARMTRGDDGVVKIFFIEPAARNTEGADIPWEDFDKNVPIATISPSDNGKMELDWLGFTVNGDLAMDYAIYGKKTLEGPYKKK